MATSEQKRQKKLKQRKQKQNQVKKRSNTLSNTNPVTLFSKYPIHDCLVPDNLHETGLGTIVISRRSPGGEIGCSAFVVDIYCLGVKDAMFTINDENEYEDFLKPRLIRGNEGNIENVHPACVRKLVEGAVSYARDLGFAPHPDYRKYKALFGDIDKSVCPEKYAFGKEGKPFYINGPNETSKQSERIIKQLENICGEGNFNFMLGSGDFLEE